MFLWISSWLIKKISSQRLPPVNSPCYSLSKPSFQLKNEYKSFLARKVEIERDLVEVESQEVELR